MWFPLVVLAVLSVGGGWFLAQGQRFEHWLEPSSGPTFLKLSEHPENLPFGLSLMGYSLIAAIGGLVLGMLVYWKGLPKTEGWDERRWNPLRRLARDQFLYDPAVMTAAVEGGNDFGRFMWRFFDAGVVDGIVNGVAKLAGWFALVFRRVQTGYVRAYALLMLVGGVGVLVWFAYASTISGGGH
jgi:NADH-quinone oxidoreductase subunit L